MCLSAILSSAPTNVAEVESEFVRLIQEIASSSAEESKTEAELAGVVSDHRLPEMPRVLEGRVRKAPNRYGGARPAISGYAASPPPPPGGRGEDASGNDNEGGARLRERVVRRGGVAMPSTAGVLR